jgi:tetratricopeptide (TPR) repeat protein
MTIPVQGTVTNPLVRYYTIGFNISAGSNAERDLQYLAQKSGGKYLNAQDEFELTKAFQKFNRVFIPKEVPSIDTLSVTAKTLFNKGLGLINDEEFDKALESYKQFAKGNSKDCNGFYNLALMFEANEYFKSAIKNYENYLQLCPNTTDKDYVKKQIEALRIEYDKYVEYNKKVVISDMEYLNLHFKKIQNGESVALAIEFIGFIKEKWVYYKNLAEIIENDDRLFKTNATEVFRGLKECVETIKRNPQAWDRDATPVLSRTYLNMERLIKSF